MTEATVWVLVIDNEYGANISAHKSEDGAMGNLAGYVAQWWDAEMRDQPLPDNPQHAIDEYFENVEADSYTIRLCTIYE